MWENRSGQVGEWAGEEGVWAGEEGVWAGEEGVWAGEEGVWAGEEGVWAGEEGVGITDEGGRRPHAARTTKGQLHPWWGGVHVYLQPKGTCVMSATPRLPSGDGVRICGRDAYCVVFLVEWQLQVHSERAAQRQTARLYLTRPVLPHPQGVTAWQQLLAGGNLESIHTKDQFRMGENIVSIHGVSSSHGDYGMLREVLWHVAWGVGCGKSRGVL